MGLEATCKAKFGGKASEGKLQWETDFLLFRGEFRLKILSKEIRTLSVAKQALVVEFAEGKAEFQLGGQAEKWREKIANPPTLFDKLGVKKQHRIALVNWKDEGFARDLAALAGDVVDGAGARECDIVFLGAAVDKDLDRLTKLEPMLKRAGAIWIVYPKGLKAITEMSVMNAARAAGFVDSKTCKFSKTHTALRVVIPVARR